MHEMSLARALVRAAVAAAPPGTRIIGMQVTLGPEAAGESALDLALRAAAEGTAAAGAVVTLVRVAAGGVRLASIDLAEVGPCA